MPVNWLPESLQPLTSRQARVPFSPPLAAPSIPTVAPTPETAPPVTRSKAKATKAKQPDTVPITLRPSNALLNKYVIKASERTREEGRVVSAQQIMLEALERSDA